MQRRKLNLIILALFLFLGASLLKTAYLHDQWKAFWISIAYLFIAALFTSYLLDEKT